MTEIDRRRALTTLAGTGVALFGGWPLSAAEREAGETDELGEHRIASARSVRFAYRWPRFVGRNGSKDYHGQHHRGRACLLRTDRGAVGWGLGGGITAKVAEGLVGRRVSDLVSVSRGLADGVHRGCDFALHDLMGVVLGKPVYELLGAHGETSNTVYSGMIYLDELNEGVKDRAIDVVLENCAWDVEYGYRQLKIKIGRSGRWYEHDAGLAKDVEIVRAIHDRFARRGVELLVDANDAYTLEDTIAFLKGIAGVPLYWVEEPFRETVRDGRALRRWMDANGFEKTRYADGEANPDHDVCMELARTGDLDTYLPDVAGLGFTPWRRLMPRLRELGLPASPHAWGSRLKTHYVAHLAAGLGNVDTIEGVTCLSEDIDFGDYPIEKGQLRVSDAPGFGMKLLVD